MCLAWTAHHVCILAGCQCVCVCATAPCCWVHPAHPGRGLAAAAVADTHLQPRKFASMCTVTLLCLCASLLLSMGGTVCVCVCVCVCVSFPTCNVPLYVRVSAGAVPVLWRGPVSSHSLRPHVSCRSQHRTIACARVVMCTCAVFLVCMCVYSCMHAFVCACVCVCVIFMCASVWRCQQASQLSCARTH
jgi:hypothetical protein